MAAVKELSEKSQRREAVWPAPRQVMESPEPRASTAISAWGQKTGNFALARETHQLVKSFSKP